MIHRRKSAAWAGVLFGFGLSASMGGAEAGAVATRLRKPGADACIDLAEPSGERPNGLDGQTKGDGRIESWFRIVRERHSCGLEVNHARPVYSPRALVAVDIAGLGRFDTKEEAVACLPVLWPDLSQSILGTGGATAEGFEIKLHAAGRYVAALMLVPRGREEAALRWLERRLSRSHVRSLSRTDEQQPKTPQARVAPSALALGKQILRRGRPLPNALDDCLSRVATDELRPWRINVLGEPSDADRWVQVVMDEFGCAGPVPRNPGVGGGPAAFHVVVGGLDREAFVLVGGRAPLAPEGVLWSHLWWYALRGQGTGALQAAMSGSVYGIYVGTAPGESLEVSTYVADGHLARVLDVARKVLTSPDRIAREIPSDWGGRLQADLRLDEWRFLDVMTLHRKLDRSLFRLLARRIPSDVRQLVGDQIVRVVRGGGLVIFTRRFGDDEKRAVCDLAKALGIPAGTVRQGLSGVPRRLSCNGEGADATP